jgi:hypothetical protein
LPIYANRIDESGGQHESSTRKTFRIIKTNTIQQIVKFDPGQKRYVPFGDLSAPLPPVNLEKLREVCILFIFNVS